MSDGEQRRQCSRIHGINPAYWRNLHDYEHAWVGGWVDSRYDRRDFKMVGKSTQDSAPVTPGFKPSLWKLTFEQVVYKDKMKPQIKLNSYKSSCAVQWHCENSFKVGQRPQVHILLGYTIFTFISDQTVVFETALYQPFHWLMDSLQIPFWGAIKKINPNFTHFFCYYSPWFFLWHTKLFNSDIRLPFDKNSYFV